MAMTGKTGKTPRKTLPPGIAKVLKRLHYPLDVILLCVRWYVAYPLTLAEISLLGTYTYSMADMRATVAALDGGAFGNLGWAEIRPLQDGSWVFKQLAQGAIGSSKVILVPE